MFIIYNVHLSYIEQRERKMVTLGILLKIDFVVYVCICTIYTAFLKQFTQHAFVFDGHFSRKETSERCGAIIDNISYLPTYVME